MYSDGLLKLPIFTIQKNFKILLTVYSLSPHLSLIIEYIKNALAIRWITKAEFPWYHFVLLHLLLNTITHCSHYKQPLL